MLLKLFTLFLLPFSLLFRVVVCIRNFCYDHFIQKVVCAPKVISVGNISVGGTGKTPFVIELCKILKEQQKKVAVIGRSYKSSSTDEMLLIQQKANVDVFFGKSKSKLVHSLEVEGKLEQYDIIIIDDGFQHRKLARDLDIVLIDQRSLNEHFLLPAGRLREPFSSLYRATDIYLTKEAKYDDLLKRYEPTNEQKVYRVSMKLGTPKVAIGDTVAENSDVIAVTGIAQPQEFFKMLANKNRIRTEIAFDDHHKYTEHDIAEIAKLCENTNCYTLATTEKDAMKLKKIENKFKEYNISLIVYPLETEIIEAQLKNIRILK